MFLMFEVFTNRLYMDVECNHTFTLWKCCKWVIIAHQGVVNGKSTVSVRKWNVPFEEPNTKTFGLFGLKG